MTHPSIRAVSHVLSTWAYSPRYMKRLLHMCDMTFSYVWHDPSKYSSSITRALNPGLQPSMCDMTHSYVWHDSFIRVTWLIYVFVPQHTCFQLGPAALDVSQDSFICVTWLIHVWHDSFICVTWLLHMRHDSFMWDMSDECDTTIGVTRLIHMRGMTHSRLTDSFICAEWLTHVWHDSFICDTTPSYVWHD